MLPHDSRCSVFQNLDGCAASCAFASHFKSGGEVLASSRQLIFVHACRTHHRSHAGSERGKVAILRLSTYELNLSGSKQRPRKQKQQQQPVSTTGSSQKTRRCAFNTPAHGYACARPSNQNTTEFKPPNGCLLSRLHMLPW